MTHEKNPTQKNEGKKNTKKENTNVDDAQLVVTQQNIFQTFNDAFFRRQFVFFFITRFYF